MTPLATADRFYSKHFLCHILPAIKWTQTDLLNQKTGREDYTEKIWDNFEGEIATNYTTTLGDKYGEN